MMVVMAQIQHETDNLREWRETVNPQLCRKIDSRNPNS